MRIGFHIVHFEPPAGPEDLPAWLARVAAASEACQADNLSVMDHYFQLEYFGGGEAPMLEAYSTLGYLAALTSRIELQVLVTGVTYRHPGLLAKIATTVDVLSGGRSMLGIGAAWYEREHLGLGVPFPPLTERYERLEEALQIIHQMWSDDDGPYQGKYYQLAETMCLPRPLQVPHPPIMIGGSGERKTLRLVAAYADACNLFGGPGPGVEGIRSKLGILNEHCDREGRSIDDIRLTMTWGGEFDSTPAGIARFAEEMAAYAEVGIEEVHLSPNSRDAASWIEEFGPALVGAVHEIP